MTCYIWNKTMRRVNQLLWVSPKRDTCLEASFIEKKCRYQNIIIYLLHLIHQFYLYLVYKSKSSLKYIHIYIYIYIYIFFFFNYNKNKKLTKVKYKKTFLEIFCSKVLFLNPNPCIKINALLKTHFIFFFNLHFGTLLHHLFLQSWVPLTFNNMTKTYIKSPVSI